MLAFPQLSSGALVQFPMMRTLHHPLQSIRTPGGGEQHVALPAGQGMAWEMSLDAMTEDEAEALRAFFVSTRGALQEFTFYDPGDNLLLWSSDLRKPAWQATGVLVTEAPGVDPGEVGFQINNNLSTSAGIGQVVQVPGSYQTCFSAWLRSEQESTAELTASSGAVSRRLVVGVGPTWQRLVASGRLGTSAEATQFSIELPAGAVVQIYGPQVEAQPFPSAYRKTGARSGVYPSTRFVDDSLRIEFTAPGQHSASIRLFASFE